MSAPDRPSEKALGEFLSEAQEIVENLNRDLLGLDQQRADGRFSPDLVNDAFRAVHSLKGLSGLFGITKMIQLSHNLESLLDQLRLGKVHLGPEVLDTLFESVELFGNLIRLASRGEEVASSAVDAYIRRLEAIGPTRPQAAAGDPWGGYELEASMLSVLTEYEEHRLRENIREGRLLMRVHSALDLMTLDKKLEELKSQVRLYGELISCLPSADAAADMTIELDLLLGAESSLEVVTAALTAPGVEVHAVPRKAGAGVVAPYLPAAPAYSSYTPPMPPPPPSRSPSPEPPSRPAEPAPAAEEGADVADGTASLKSISQTVRVDIRKLDHLMNVVGELALVRAGLVASLEILRQDRSHLELARAMQRDLRSLERKIDELQNGILEVRMVPLGQIFDKLSRVVRRISRDSGKQVRLVITGADTELDKLIVEELSDPLMHIMRNAIDHGIEAPELRIERGKPAIGVVTIDAAQRGNHVVIDVSDDGAGLDEALLVEKAVERGLIDRPKARELTRREAFNLIFLPGVSTKGEVTELSGRGVGMDVVKTNISRLSGLIDVDSMAGEGTRLQITLPITLAIIQALIIKVVGRTYAVPLNSVLESILLEPGSLRTIEGKSVITLRGATLPLLRLADAFHFGETPVDDGQGQGPAQAQAQGQGKKRYVVVVGLAQHRLGLVVDELLGQQDIVIKSLGSALGAIPGIAGATELGGQKVVLVLDVGALVEEALGWEHGAFAA